MARSLEWTSPCEQGKKIKGTVSRNLSKFKQQDSTYKRKPFFKTCWRTVFHISFLLFVTFDITPWGDVCYKVVMLSSTRK